MSVWNPKNAGELKAIQTLLHESDRSAAIITATFVEDRLTQGIICRFRRDTGKAKGIIDNMLGIDGPIGAFASKIKLGYLLRLYGKQVYNELHTIRMVRNRFAHIIGDGAPLSFSEPTVSNLCHKLTLIEHYVRPASDIPPDFFDPAARVSVIEATRCSGISFGEGSTEQLANPRFRFVETCGLLAERFQNPDHPRDPQLPDEFLILGDEPYPLP